MGYGGSDGIEGHVEEVEKSESDDREKWQKTGHVGGHPGGNYLLGEELTWKGDTWQATSGGWRERGTTRANRRNERMTRGDWGQADGRMI